MKNKAGFFSPALVGLVLIFLAGIFISLNCQSSAGGTPKNEQVSTGSKTDTTGNDVITAPPPELGLDTFYKKYLDASGIPIISSEKVPDEALFAVQRTVNIMVSYRP